jgi:hypothetical protein
MILKIRSFAQMVRPYALRRIARVKNVVFGPSPPSQKPSNMMSTLSRRKSKSSIYFWSKRTNPKPAAFSLEDFGPETFRDCFFLHVLILTQSGAP